MSAMAGAAAQAAGTTGGGSGGQTTAKTATNGLGLWWAAEATAWPPSGKAGHERE